LSSTFTPICRERTLFPCTLQLVLQISFIVAFTLVLASNGSAQTMNSSQSRPTEGATTLPSSTFPETPANPGTVPVAPETPANSATTPPTATSAMPFSNQSRYVISPGDVLNVSVFGAPDLSQGAAAVNSAGDIYLPLINYVHVGGMHVEEAQGAVEQAYLKSNVLKFPHVSIVVTSYSSGVILMGEVGRTGIYPLVGSGRLFDILAEAGGVSATAGQTITITHKDGIQETVHLSSDPEHTLSANVPVQQGDTIIVSKAGVIYVVGEVLSPSGFLMDEKGQYTVMKAVAMAHGVTKLAKTSKARIVRRTPNGQQEIPVPLNKILLSKAPDIPMQSNDILFIPSSKEKQAANTAAGVAVGLASGVAYWGLYH
jgi:polysaccharide biosynthesis/export protein